MIQNFRNWPTKSSLGVMALVPTSDRNQRISPGDPTAGEDQVAADFVSSWPARTERHFGRLFAVIRAYLDDLHTGRLCIDQDRLAATATPRAALPRVGRLIPFLATAIGLQRPNQSNSFGLPVSDPIAKRSIAVVIQAR